MPPFPRIPGQHDLATNRQLLAAGWSRAAINTLSSKHGQQVLPRVYCRHRGPLTPEDRLLAGALWAGSGSVLTSAWALARHGLTLSRMPTTMTFLVCPSKRDRSTAYTRTTRTNRLPDGRLIDGLAVAPPERAIADLGRLSEGPFDWQRATTIAALQQRLTTPARLEAELDAGRPNGTVGVRTGLEDFRNGAWSLPEVTLERLLSRHRRSYRFLANPVLSTAGGQRIGVPDGYLPDYGLAIQVHSRSFHSGVDADGRDQWGATVEADSVYLAHGIGVLGVVPRTLESSPERFLASLDAAVHARRRVPVPLLRIEPRQGPGTTDASSR